MTKSEGWGKPACAILARFSMIFEKMFIPTREQAKISEKSRNCRNLHLNLKWIRLAKMPW
jgi:hypothetical protein